MEGTAAPISQQSARDYLNLLWHHKLLIALSVLLGVGLGVASSARTTPMYESRSEVLLQPRSSETLYGGDAGSSGGDRDRTVQTEIKILSSEGVRELVGKQTGLTSVPPVFGSAIGRTDVIALAVRSPDPKLAARVANAYASAYIEFRRTQAVTDLVEASKQVAAQILELDHQIAATKDPSERSALIGQQSTLNQQVSQLDVGSRLRRGGAQLVTSAFVPTSPFAPTPVRTAALGLVLGLLAGIGFALLREYLDDTIRDGEDLERSLRGAPTLGQIPAVSSWRDKNSTVLVSLTDPTSAEAEAYRAFRTSITFAGLEKSVRTILFSSGKASEGKTTTVANLGVALARTGKRVVLIDADLRRPRINQFFDVDNAIGLTSVLVGDHGLGQALVKVGGDTNLTLLPSGPIPPNPSELLSGSRMAELIASLADRHDFVLIDSPPMLPVSDAMALSGSVDAVVVVATARSSTRREMARCLEILEHVEAPLLGSVFNRTRTQAGYGYGYGYGYASKPSDPGSEAAHRLSGAGPIAARTSGNEYPAAFAAFDQLAGAPDASAAPARESSAR